MSPFPAGRLLLVAVIVVLGACGDGDDGGGAADAPTPFALRPVLASTEPPCPEDSPKQGADVLPEVVDGKTEACLEVGPPIVEAGHVRSAALGRHLGGTSVSIVLGQTGSANLDDHAARNQGERLAIVVYGKVIRAPTISSPSFLGRVEVVGLSEEEAERLLGEFDTTPGS